MRRVPELDGVRGTAILLVLLFHYIFIPFHPPAGLHWLWTIGMLGGGGVDLFFVLSGFLIGGILLDAREAGSYFRVFYFRRVCRILPPYAAVLLLIGLARILGGAAAPAAALTFPWWTYATFTQNVWMAAAGTMGVFSLAATWSLAIEEQFYLTLPFAVRSCSRRVLQMGVAAAIVGAPIVRVILHAKHYPLGAYVLMPARADALAVGVATALLVRSRAAMSWLTAHERSVTALIAAGTSALIALAFKDEYFLDRPVLLVGHSILAMVSALVIVSALTHRMGVLARALRLTLMRRLGTIAYTVYLIHIGILWLCHVLVPETRTHVVGREVVVTVVALVLTLAIAQASWIWLERPFVRLGHRLNYDDAPAAEDSLTVAYAGRL